MELQLVVVVAFALLGLANAGCSLIDRGPMKCDMIKETLDLHNKLRSEVIHGKKSDLPAGKNMFALKWDKKLQKESQVWANMCEFKHSSGQYGENLSKKTYSDERMGNISYLVTMWINEINIPYKYAEFTGGGGFGHFTQMIWANTKFMGCGLSFYKNEGSNIPYETYLVCRYSPAGNVLKQFPYEQGGDGKCDNGFNHKKYSGLCAHDKQDYDDVNYNPCSGGKESAFGASILTLIVPFLSYLLLNDF